MILIADIEDLRMKIEDETPLTDEDLETVGSLLGELVSRRRARRCDYRNLECSATGTIINRKWICDRHWKEGRR